jgi:SSS family solute:Na+ symporter
MQTSTLDLVIIAVYLVGITLFGCSFYFRKGGKDARTFTTGGGHIPGWAIALSIFATQVSSISFLALPAKAFLSNWNCFVLTLTIPIAAFVAARWFVPFYRRSTSVSAYAFLEERFGPWARIYASLCFLVMQTARSGVILFLLALTLKSALGFSCFWIIVVTGIVTMLYAMLGGFKAVIWADAIQSLILLLGTLAVIVSLCFNIPGGLGHGFQLAWDAGKFSLGSFSLKEWGIETFWVSFFYGVCINLQNYGIDQSFTQRYIAAKDDRSAAKSAFSGAMMYIPGTFLFVMVGTLLWMFGATHPGLIPAEVSAQSDAVFPWYIVHRLPHGISGLLVAAIIAAAMSTVAATLNSGSTVLLEDYYKRFFPGKADAVRNIRFLRAMTVLLTVASICVAVAVMNVSSALTVWWGMQSVLSGGMLGLFLLGAYSKRTTSTQAAVATVLGVLVVVFITFGQSLLHLSPLLHVNLSIALGTLTLFLTGWLLATCKKKSK